VTADRLTEIDAAAAPIVTAFAYAATVDLVPYLHVAYAGRLEREIAAPLRAAIADAIAAVAQLELLLDGDRQREPTETDWEDGQRLTDELWRQVADVCFAARGDLRRAERTIHGAHAGGASHDERLAACEGAHRKLRRALGAVLGALGRASDRSFPVLAELDGEAGSAVAVRRMYAKFRRSLPPCDPGEPASVRRALRYAAVSLAVMVGAGDFSDIRTQDRALLLQLQSRILRWARDGASDGDGVALYRDIVIAADLLRSINLRQELAAHDQRRLGEAAAALAADDPAAALAAARPALRDLDGRDDALDALVERSLREPPSDALVRALRAALAPAPDSGEGPE